MHNSREVSMCEMGRFAVMDRIQQIYDMMDWWSDDAIQAEGRKLAEKWTDLSLLILPDGKKSVWENCANVLSEKSDEALQPYLAKLLIWLQDMNWPGAFVIAERLKRVKMSILCAPLSQAIDVAEKKADSIWLDYLAIFLENKELKSHLDVERYHLLEQHYQNFWGDKD